MLKERFLGRHPSNFIINPVVKSYIISEAFLWSAWDFVIPLFSVFVVTTIPGGTIQTAATGYSVYLIARVIFELTSGKLLLNTSDKKKFLFTIIGMIVISCAYAGFAISQTPLAIFVFYGLMGAGLGIATPGKSAIFSMHLDKNKEATEWSLADAVCAICMAFATPLGGFIVMQYGFAPLFLLASVVNLLGIIPYLLYLLD